MLDLNSIADRLWDWLTDDFNCAAALATVYPGRALAALATRVGLSFAGHRVEKVPRAELLDGIRQTMRVQPAERKRVLEEIVAALQSHRWPGNRWLERPILTRSRGSCHNGVV